MRHTEQKVPTVTKYNWKLLKKYTNNNPRKMLDFFYNVYVLKTENYFYLNPWAAHLVKESSNNKHQYIQNIEELYEESKRCTDSELYIYFDLASQRSYFTFINTGGKANYLPTWKINNYDVEKLKLNRLLTFDNNNIYLLYEGEN